MSAEQADFSFAIPSLHPSHHQSHSLNQSIDISFQQPHIFTQELQHQHSSKINNESEELDDVKSVKSQMMNTLPKSSIEIEIERIQAEKKALLKYKRKQEKLYQRIRKEQQELKRAQGLDKEEDFCGKSKEIVSSYVQQIMQQIKTSNDQASSKDFEGVNHQVKRQKKLRDLRNKKKTLTVFTPFELRTAKRIRTENEQLLRQNEEFHQPYEPLWLQVQNSFKLRDSTNQQPTIDHIKPSLTVPKPPNLHTNERMKLKDVMEDHQQESAQKTDYVFKARPFNSKIFTEKPQDRLPSVSKKETTTIEEFSLSQPVYNHAKKTLNEYLQSRDAPQTFKALPLDKKILEQGPACNTPRKEKPHITEATPFVFKTHERINKQKSIDRENHPMSGGGDSSVTLFKARAMPKYKFFEVKHGAQNGEESAKKQVVFKEFNLATANIKRVRSNSQEQQQQEDQHVFHALPVPDFSKQKPKTCIKKETTSTVTQPFALTTNIRGSDKRAKLEQAIAIEKKQAIEMARFKAREYKPQDSHIRAASLGGAGSGKTTPSAALLAVVKEFKLHSLLRSQQREEFDKKMKDKEIEQTKTEQERLEELKRQEEEEVRRIRAQMRFKASKIKKYRFTNSIKEPETRPLTVPQPPKLHTLERSKLRDDLQMDVMTQ